MCRNSGLNVSSVQCVMTSPQVNSTSVRKQEGKKAATAGADQKSAAKSSSVSKPTPGKSEDCQFGLHQISDLLFLLSY